GEMERAARHALLRLLLRPVSGRRAAAPAEAVIAPPLQELERAAGECEEGLRDPAVERTEPVERHPRRRLLVLRHVERAAHGSLGPAERLLEPDRERGLVDLARRGECDGEAVV